MGVQVYLSTMLVLLSMALCFPLILAQGTGICPFANNTLGDCECYGQVFIADSCHKGFFCRGAAGKTEWMGEFYDGCEITCWEDEVLVIDPHNGIDWHCERNLVNNASRPGICPGKLNTECGCSPDVAEEDCPIGECECVGQYRVSHDCHKAKTQAAAMEPSMWVARLTLTLTLTLTMMEPLT